MNCKRKGSNDEKISPQHGGKIQMFGSNRKKNENSQKSGVSRKSQYTTSSKLLKSQLFSTISRTNNFHKNQQTLKERDIEIELLEGSLANLIREQMSIALKMHKTYLAWSIEADKLSKQLNNNYP